MCGEILVALVSGFRVVFITDGVVKFEFSGVFFFWTFKFGFRGLEV